MRVTPKVRKLVFQRDYYRCVHCGTMSGLTIQHRINRGMGGSKSRGGLENLVTLCGYSNGLLESNADFARLGMDYGWKLRSWEDPFNREVWYEPDGAWFYLTDRGTRAKVGETADRR